MKKLCALLLSVVLLISVTAPAMAAESATATTLRLEKIQGTATVKNASGKDVPSRSGTRLYNGYSVSTEKASYAFISLDETKAVKLDASSSSTVKQAGKNLEIAVTSGSMFFNVTAPVKSDESLSIRTSTMVTGVRGTCGWITVLDAYTTQLSLLEGELDISSFDPLTGEERSVKLTGGQTATVVFEGVGEGFDPGLIGQHMTIQELIDLGLINSEHIILTDTGLTIEALQEEDVPASVAVEVAKDPELQQRIEELTDLSVPAIIADAEERLAAEQAAAEEKDKAIQKAVNALSADEVDPLFEEEIEKESSGSSSGSNNTTIPVAPAPDTPPASIPFDGGSVNDLNNELANANGTVVELNGAVTDQGTISVPADQTLVLAENADLNGQPVIVDGTLSVTGSNVTNSSDIIVNNDQSLDIEDGAVLTNTGSIQIGETASGTLRVKAGGKLINNTQAHLGVGGDTAAGAMEIAEGGSVVNNGNLYINDTGTLTNNGDITGSGSIYNYGVTNHYGTITTSATHTFEVSGGTLNISDATVANTNTAGYVINFCGEGAAVTISNSTVTSAYIGIGCSEGGASNNTATITGSTLTCGSYGIGFYTGTIDSGIAEDGTGTITEINISTDSTVSGQTYDVYLNRYGGNPIYVVVKVGDEVIADGSNGPVSADIASSSVSNTYMVYYYLEPGDTEYLEAQELLENVPTTLDYKAYKGGYTQTHWVDANGTRYELRQSVTLTADLHLYGQWSQDFYTVTLDANNGDENTVFATFEHVDGVNGLTLPTEVPTNSSGAQCLGWAPYADASSVYYAPGEEFDPAYYANADGNATLYAVWSIYTYLYDANVAADDPYPASGTMAPSYHMEVRSSEIADSQFTRPGYMFYTFNPLPNGKGDLWELDSYVSEGSTTLTLYAIWKPVITFYANDGSGATATQQIDDSSYTSMTLHSCTFTRDGYTFKGWATAADSTTVTYTDNYRFEDNSWPYEPMHLYAVWEEAVSEDSSAIEGNIV